VPPPADTPIVSVVIPTYNGSQTLRPLVLELHEALCQVEGGYEIIVVDDGSKDNSWEIVRTLVQEGLVSQGLRLTRNFGQTAATMAGIRVARGEVVITMDDDLQNPPSEVITLLRALEADPDLDAVIGVPKEKQHSFYRRIGSAFVNRISNVLFSKDPHFRLTSFRAIRRRLVDPLTRLNVPSPPIGALLCTLSNNIKNVTVEHRPSGLKGSRFNMFRLLAVTISKLIGFSIAPLRAMASLGFIGFILSVLWGVMLVVKYLLARIQVPGWMTIALMLAIIASILFMGFGIIGEYLYQILMSTRNTPQFAVQYHLIAPTPPKESEGTMSSRENP